jgi:hypothetical protein
MIFLTRNYRLLIQNGFSLLVIFLLFIHSLDVSAQEPPPRPVEVTVYQHLGFGAFTPGLTGGTVIISATGSRSSTDDVILLNLGYSVSVAIYRLVANPGTLITIMNGSDVSLIGSNGGTMVLHIGTSDPVSPFVINTVPPNYTLMSMGATLTVGNALANPPGSYDGTFYITFNQE